MAMFSTVTFNDAGRAQFGGAATASVKLSYDNRLPFGHAFYLEMILAGGVVRGLGVSAAVAATVPSAAMLQEINTMGIKEWIKKNICPWVRASVQEQLGAYVGASAPPVVSVTVTAGNITDQMNAAIDRDFSFVLDAKGLPDLVAKG